MLYLMPFSGRLHKEAMKKFFSEFNELIDLYFNSPFSLQCTAMVHSLDFFIDRVEIPGSRARIFQDLIPGIPAIVFF